MPIRVAIDGTPVIGPRTGIGHVTANLIGALAHRSDLRPVVYAVTLGGRDELARNLPPGVEACTSRTPARLVRPLWARGNFPKIEHWTGPVDLVHATNYVAPPSRAPVVVTVHDLAYAHSAHLVSKDTRQGHEPLLRAALARGAIVHTVSDFVGREVRDLYGLTADRVRRVYPGLGPVAGGDASAGRRVAAADDYLLALGQIEPRKNYPLLVRAFDRVAAQHPSLSLVIAGPAGWGVEEFEQARATTGCADRIRWLGYVSDDDRRDLLAGARGFVYPSRYEGFGHPPLEAMTAGIPTVTSNAGALPEIVGDAALMVDPDDDIGLAGAMARLVDDDELRAELVRRGHDRTKRYRWDDAADAFVALYSEIVAAAGGSARVD